MIRSANSTKVSLVISKPHNKAHTATGNRIAKRFDTQFTPDAEFDVATGDLKVAVETSASMESALLSLESEPGRVYVALTNKDGVNDALRVGSGRVGIMDAHGNVIRECNCSGASP
jgi:hypothetical protein